MDYIKTIKIFLASPMDLTEERRTFCSTIDLINSSIGKAERLRFEILNWEEDTSPNIGADAQDVVNAQIIADYDILVCLFKERIGTPTNRYNSGTVEEYERAKIKRITKPSLDIMVYYFATAAEVPEITALKSAMANDGVLYWEVKEDFSKLIIRHFSNKLRKYIQISSAPTKFKIRDSVSVALVQNNKVLYIKRALSSNVGPGLWQLPGGKIDDGESIENAAVREIGEELSIALKEENLRLLNVFDTFFMNDKSKPFKMHLFIYDLTDEEKPEINLNAESIDYKWVDVYDFPSDMPLMGINDAMTNVILREIYLCDYLDKLFRETKALELSGLPAKPAMLSTRESGMIYGFLSILGLTDLRHGNKFTSEYAHKLLEILIGISRANNSIFTDGANDGYRDMQLQNDDLAKLNKLRNSAFNSHKSLLSYLSVKANIRHKVRNICNALIFARCGDKKYLLMRWDFFAKKFQMISGEYDVNENDEYQLARAVMEYRLPAAIPFVGAQFVKSFTVNHFSAGSIDNDPIMRRYNIKAVLIKPLSGGSNAIKEAVSETNTQCLNKIMNFSMDQEALIGLQCYVWCDLEELVAKQIEYMDMPVRGIKEFCDNIGRQEIFKLSEQNIEITCEDVEAGVGCMCVANGLL